MIRRWWANTADIWISIGIIIAVGLICWLAFAH